MVIFLRRMAYLMVLIALSSIIGTSWAQAEEPRDMHGWGIDDPYNKLYDVREYEKIRAWVVRVKEVVPMPGMSPATALDVREGSDLSYLVPQPQRDSIAERCTHQAKGRLDRNQRQGCLHCIQNKKRPRHRHY